MLSNTPNAAISFACFANMWKSSLAKSTTFSILVLNASAIIGKNNDPNNSILLHNGYGKINNKQVKNIKNIISILNAFSFDNSFNPAIEYRKLFLIEYFGFIDCQLLPFVNCLKSNGITLNYWCNCCIFIWGCKIKTTQSTY